jgi:hypothetical protein
MSKFNMVDLDGNSLGSLDSSSNTVKNSSGKTLYTIKGKYLISEADDEVLTVENDGRVADESGKQVGYIYNYKDFKESRSTSKSTTKTTSSTTSRSTSSSSTSNTKSSTTTSKPKPTPTTNNPTTKKDSWTDWLWLGVIVLVLIWLFGPKSIPGTWVVSGIEYEGKTYSITESDFKKLAEDSGSDVSSDRIERTVKTYKKMELNFKKGGSGTIRSDEYNQGYSRFTWDKDGNEVTIETETTWEDYGAVTKLEMKGGKLRLESGDVTIIFKKK